MRMASLALVMMITAPATAVQRQCFNRCAPRVQVVPTQAPVVQINPSVFPGLQPFQYRVSPQLREEALAELIAQKVVEKLQGAQPGSGENPAKAVEQHAQSSRLVEAQAVINARCLNCHNGTKEGRINLTDLASIPDGADEEIFKKAYRGQMPPPPNGTPLSDEEVYKLMRWSVYR